MPNTTTLVPGHGHLPCDHAQTTLLDVHLRACGFEWLRQVAEERLRGRIFTPEEILQRQPGVAASPVSRMPVRDSTPDVLGRIRRALAEVDAEARGAA